MVACTSSDSIDENATCGESNLELCTEITDCVNSGGYWFNEICHVNGLDCNGDEIGDAYLDNCNNCVGGDTGNTACVQDCYGEWGGSAIEDTCGVCEGDGSSCQSEGTCETGTQTVILGEREWQRCDDGNRYEYSEAIAYCESLVLDGNSDWYLPRKDELKTLVSCGNGKTTPLFDWDASKSNDENLIDATCGGEGFANFNTPTISESFECRNDSYWSLTPGDPDVAYSVGFHSEGAAALGARTDTLYARCVREQQPVDVSDCNGDLDGTAYLDNCGNCVAGNTGNTVCVQDCNGRWGGSAVADVCGVCEGDGSSCQGVGVCGNGALTGIWQGLEWQCVDDGNRYVFSEANTYCDNLVLDDKLDWYLPGKDELKTLVSCGNGKTTPLFDWDASKSNDENLIDATCGGEGFASFNTPTIIESFECRNDSYWSSSPGNPLSAFSVGFHSEGAAALGARTDTLYARCVREPSDCNGDMGGSAYLDYCGDCVSGNTGNTACVQDCYGEWGGSAVLDICGVCDGDGSSCQSDGTCATGAQTVFWASREWQRCEIGDNSYSFNEANAYCDNLVLDDKSDWRLPSKDELKSLVYCSNGKSTPLLDWDFDSGKSDEQNYIDATCGGNGYAVYDTPTISPSFPEDNPGYFWSSSMYDADNAWEVDFGNGYAHWYHLEGNGYVRCVR